MSDKNGKGKEVRANLQRPTSNIQHPTSNAKQPGLVLGLRSLAGSSERDRFVIGSDALKKLAHPRERLDSRQVFFFEEIGAIFVELFAEALDLVSRGRGSNGRKEKDKDEQWDKGLDGAPGFSAVAFLSDWRET